GVAGSRENGGKWENKGLLRKARNNVHSIVFQNTHTNNPNAPEEEPIMDQAPAALSGFAPQWIGEQILDNNIGWLKEDPEEEPKEEEENEAMVNDEEDDAEMYDRYRTEKKMAKILRQDELRKNGQEFDITALDSAVRANRSESEDDEEEPSIHTAPVPRANDPYVMVRDAARGTREDEDVDTIAP
nr:hypothetical protein [Tanacetum cinerariifolium]